MRLESVIEGGRRVKKSQNIQPVSRAKYFVYHPSSHRTWLPSLSSHFANVRTEMTIQVIPQDTLAREL